MMEFVQYDLDESMSHRKNSSEISYSTVVRPLHSNTKYPLLSHLSESNNRTREINIIRQLPFMSALQRTSVIVTNQKDTFTLLIKGSPEKILELALPETSMCIV